MAITITREEIEHKDEKYLRQRIEARVAEYKASSTQSRGELLVEIQILMNRIDSIHSEQTEKRSLFLEWVVIGLILIEVVLAGFELYGGRAVQASIDKKYPGNAANRGNPAPIGTLTKKTGSVECAA